LGNSLFEYLVHILMLDEQNYIDVHYLLEKEVRKNYPFLSIASNIGQFIDLVEKMIAI